MLRVLFCHFQMAARRVPTHLQRMVPRGAAHGIPRQQIAHTAAYNQTHANQLAMVRKMVGRTMQTVLIVEFVGLLNFVCAFC